MYILKFCSLKKVQVFSIFILFILTFTVFSGCVEHRYCPPAPEGWFSDGTGDNLIVFIDTLDTDVGKIVLYTKFFDGNIPNSINEWKEYDCLICRPIGGSDCSVVGIIIGDYEHLDVVSYEHYNNCITLTDGEIEVTFTEIPPPP